MLYSLLIVAATLVLIGGACIGLGVAAAGRSLQDANLNDSDTLPTGTNSANCGSIYLGGTNGAAVAGVDYTVELPAQLTGGLPDTVKLTVDVKYSAASDLSNPTTLYPSFITQTGAGGAGAAAVSKTFAVPSSVTGYLFVTVTGSATNNAASGSISLKPKV